MPNYNKIDYLISEVTVHQLHAITMGYGMVTRQLLPDYKVEVKAFKVQTQSKNNDTVSVSD